MRLSVDIEVDQQQLDDARNMGADAYVELLRDIGSELQEMVEHQWDSPDGWFRIRRIESAPAPKPVWP